MHPAKRAYAEKMRKLREEYPHAVMMRRVIERRFASPAIVEQCKKYFSYADCVINNHVVRFKNPEDAVYFRMGMWL